MKSKRPDYQGTDPSTPADNPIAVVARAYDDHAAELYRYALMILADHALAEDAMHQAFTKLIQLKRRVLTIASLPDYLRTAVRHECYSLLKKRKRHRDALKTSSSRPLLETIDPRSTDNDEHDALQAALIALPPEQREILHLKVCENQTFHRIAQLIGISANTAASRYRYAIEKLRKSLNP